MRETLLVVARKDGLQLSVTTEQGSSVWQVTCLPFGAANMEFVQFTSLQPALDLVNAVMAA